MKVLIATTDRQKGGIERALRDHYAALSSFADINLSILSPAGTFSDIAHQDKRPHILVQDYHRLMMRHAPFLSSLMLGRTQFDIILCHNGFMAPALSRHTNRLIGICHNDKPQQFKACDELICLTKGAKDNALSLGWDDTQLHIIPHYQELQKATKTISHNTPLRIGCAGRMVAKKNLALFVEIAALVKQTVPEISFHLAGDGELKGDISRLNKAKANPVILEGWVDFESFLHTIDILIIPSLDEPFGYVFIEAMSQGVGVLATQTNGAHHCLGTEISAPLFEGHDAQGFADEIIKLAQSTSKLTALKTACLKRASDDIFSKKTALTNWQKTLYPKG